MEIKNRAKREEIRSFSEVSYGKLSNWFLITNSQTMTGLNMIDGTKTHHVDAIHRA
jgi:hypothetical protein